MGKSSRKSKKRRRSPSNDRIAGLEKKITRLIDVLAQKEVRSSRLASPSLALSSSPRQHEFNTPQEEAGYDAVFPEEASEELAHIPSEADLAAPASQEGPLVQCDSGPTSKGNVTFERSPAAKIVQPNGAELAIVPSEEDTLTQELFASELEKVEVQSWNETVTGVWRELTRKGLPVEQRSSLLKKYSPSETQSFLKAPKLNPELKSGLKSNSVIKRDEYSSRDQDQVGSALCVFGEAISDLLKPEVQRSLVPEARSAALKISEGAKILADLFYRLSLSRRAQIMPTLNLIAKTTADAIPVDDLLFGVNFGEELKKATTLEKSSKDFVKAPTAVARKGQPPVKQPSQATYTPKVPSGNFRAPASTRALTTTRAGASGPSRRASYRSRSRSRKR